MDAYALCQWSRGLAIPLERIFKEKEKFVLRLVMSRYFPARIRANHLTFARMPIGAAICALLVFFPNSAARLSGDINPFSSWLGVLSLYSLAALTDLFDGPLARARGTETLRGARLDPLADKILNLPIIWICLWRNHLILVLLITGGEAISQHLRDYFMKRGQDMRANALGKIKMFLQSVSIYFILAGIHRVAVPMLWIAFGFGTASLYLQAHRVYPRFFPLS